MLACHILFRYLANLNPMVRIYQFELYAGQKSGTDQKPGFLPQTDTLRSLRVLCVENILLVLTVFVVSDMIRR